MGLFDKLKGKGADQAVLPCQQGKGVLLVRVVRSDNGQPVSGASVNIANGATPGNGASNGGGTASFNNRDPGNYTVDVPLTGALANYKIVEQENSGTVTAGGTKILTVKVAPLGHLQVNVVHEKDKAAYQHEVEITVSGADQASQVLPGGGGHRFGPLAAGKYTVTVTARGKGAWEHRIVSQQNVVVPAGGTGQAQLKLKRLSNVVTPKIETEYKVVLKDRGLSAHQAVGEVLLKADDVTRVELSLEQSQPAIGYSGKGQVTVAPGNVDIFTDAACTLPLAGKTANNLLLPGPCVLYLKGKTAGRFTLELLLDPPTEPFVEVKGPAREEMGCVELKFTLHRHDAADIQGMADIDPDVHPLSKYHKALRDAKIPPQKAMTDAQKVADGRLLHVQSSDHHDRARLVLEKLDAAHWPAGTDDHQISLVQAAGAGLTLHDKQHKGSTLALPHRLRVKDLKAKSTELWLQAGAVGAAWRDQVLSMGLDRAAGGLAHTPKLRGDWARVTAVQVDAAQLAVSYTVQPNQPDEWNAAGKRWYINLRPDPDGRKIKIKAKITPALAGVKLHCMLAPDKANQSATNSGKDLPSNWKWGTVEAAVKHSDKPARKKLLHNGADTDAQGQVEVEVTLSRFGGDIFHLGAYIDQDPHLAKYVDEHADLSQRKPALLEDALQVWRRFWYHEVKVAGIVVKGFGNAADAYEDVMAEMKDEPAVTMPRLTADAINPPVIYPKHMVSFYLNAAGTAYVNNFPGDAGDGLVVGDSNESQFMALAVKAADKPVKVPMINVHGLWIADGTSGSRNVGWQQVNANPFAAPVPVSFDKEMLDPPLQGGNLLAAGTWNAEDWDPAANGGAGAWGNPRPGVLAAADLSLDPNRSSPYAARITGATGLVVSPNGTRVRFSGLAVNGGTNFLGTSYPDGIVNCYTPNDEVDFINTITHELGHTFKQVAKVYPAGVPRHGKQYDQDGSHCNYKNKSCLMYESGPQKVHLDRFCEICHPYVLVQDMHQPMP